MSIKDIILSGYKALLNWPKQKLVEAIQILKERYIELEERNKELEKQINYLKRENVRLQEKLDSEKIRSINESANKPSSKQPEWEVKGVGNDGKGKKGKGRGNKPRKGAGNQTKNTQPTRTEKATVDHCSLCGKDLREKEALESTNDRIIKIYLSHLSSRKSY